MIGHSLKITYDGDLGTVQVILDGVDVPASEVVFSAAVGRPARLMFVAHERAVAPLPDLKKEFGSCRPSGESDIEVVFGP
jgi:hypothetical protein